MTTRRLLVSLDESVFNDIKRFAKITSSSLSKVAGDLINTSLDLEEDAMFTKIAEQRIKETESWVKHEDAWK
jgi:hypothetical protein